MKQPFVSGFVTTTAGDVPRVSSLLTSTDRWGGVWVRLGLGRMNYRVEPGLYALGRPRQDSPVLVTANYKLSFDRLRSSLPDLDAWILVLDTKGVNVWCASGKGTFGTDELAARVISSGLERVVKHRELILPQLGAPGVAAHKVRQMCAFGVVYGPVRAEDLPLFLAAGKKADAQMRRVIFPLRERLAVTPMEIVPALKNCLFIFAGLFLLGGLAAWPDFWSGALARGALAASALMLAIFAGSVFTPLLLPWLPGRAFSIKALWPGLAAALLFWAWRLESGLEVWAWLLLILALSSFLGMNFTGASTYTSLSGVKYEMRRAVPLQIGAGVLGLGFWLAAVFIS